MLVLGITIAIIFILLAFYAFKTASKIIYMLFIIRLVGSMIPKGAQQHGTNNGA